MNASNFTSELNKLSGNGRLDAPATGSSKINVDYTERMVSLTAGGLIFYSGISNLFSSPLSSLAKLAAGSFLLYRGATGYCAMYHLIDSERQIETTSSIHITTSLTVNRPRNEVFRFWRQFENLPKFMGHLKEVISIDNRRSHWEATLPGHIGKVQWNAEIVDERQDEMIAWCSIPGSMIDTAGKVEFRDNGSGGTELHVVITYRPPAGKLGETVAKWVNPAVETMLRKDIMNFKEYMETSSANASMTAVNGGKSSFTNVTSDVSDGKIV